MLDTERATEKELLRETFGSFFGAAGEEESDRLCLPPLYGDSESHWNSGWDGDSNVGQRSRQRIVVMKLQPNFADTFC